MATLASHTAAADDVIILNGTITSSLVVHNGGTAGHPVTYKFADSSTKMSKGAWGIESASAIYAAGTDNLVIDGNSAGIIECTDNGDAYGTKQAATGIHLDSCDNVEIKNLTIRNIYIHVYNTDNAVASYSTQCLKVSNNATLSVHGCTFSHAYVGIYYFTEGAGTWGNFSVYSNTMSACSTMIVAAEGGGTLSNIYIYNNDLTMGLNWYDTPNDNHIDGIHTWGTLSPVHIYNNYIHGEPSGHCTGFIYLTDVIAYSYIYNNLFVGGGTTSPMEGYINYNVTGTCHAYVLNNTIVGIASNNTGGNGIAFDPSATGTTGHVKNNIISTVYCGLYDENSNITWDSDYNCIYNVAAVGRLTAFQDTMAQWRTATGGDANSITTNPLLDGSYQLPTNSPCKEAGVSMSSYFTTDRLGTSRPQGSLWDIGMYEYPSGGPPASSTSVAGQLKTATIKFTP
jgi:hypothetical protein